MELSETTLRQHGFFTKTIFLEDIEDVSENMGAYTIKSKKKVLASPMVYKAKTSS